MTWDWTLVSWTIGEHSTHLTNEPVIFESLKLLDLGLNSSLPVHWRALYPEENSISPRSPTKNTIEWNAVKELFYKNEYIHLPYKKFTEDQLRTKPAWSNEIGLTILMHWFFTHTIIYIYIYIYIYMADNWSYGNLIFLMK